MTGNEALKAALQLLNYTDQNGQVDNANSQEFLGRALVVLNQIYADLWRLGHPAGTFSPMRDINETFALTEDICRNALIYGVAMLFAQSESDGDSQTLYSRLYNQSRTVAADGIGYVDMWEGADYT